jgi:CRP-like cAMP-binding protein
MKPGAIFGELNLLDFEEDRHEMAIAVEDSEVCFIPAETVKQLMGGEFSFPEKHPPIHRSAN